MTDFTPITPKQWSKLHDSEIAAKLGVCTRTVRRERERLGLPQVKRKPPGRPPNPITFDPSKTNKQNAERLGVTVQRAGQLRKQSWI